MALGRDRGLLLWTGVQLVISCTAIEAQIVFEILLALVTGQLAIAGQLGSVKIVKGGLCSFLFSLFYFSFSFFFYSLFLFLEQLRLGVISHAVTSVTT